MSTNALGEKASGVGTRNWIPAHGFLNVVDPCGDCSGAPRYGCKAWEGCTRRPRPHPVPNIRRVHVDKLEKNKDFACVYQVDGSEVITWDSGTECRVPCDKCWSLVQCINNHHELDIKLLAFVHGSGAPGVPPTTRSCKGMPHGPPSPEGPSTATEIQSRDRKRTRLNTATAAAATVTATTNTATTTTATATATVSSTTAVVSAAGSNTAAAAAGSNTAAAAAGASPPPRLLPFSTPIFPPSFRLFPKYPVAFDASLPSPAHPSLRLTNGGGGGGGGSEKKKPSSKGKPRSPTGKGKPRSHAGKGKPSEDRGQGKPAEPKGKSKSAAGKDGPAAGQKKASAGQGNSLADGGKAAASRKTKPGAGASGGKSDVGSGKPNPDARQGSLAGRQETSPSRTMEVVCMGVEARGAVSRTSTKPAKAKKGLAPPPSLGSTGTAAAAAAGADGSGGSSSSSSGGGGRCTDVSESMRAPCNIVQTDDDEIRRLRETTAEAMRFAQNNRVETERKLAEIQTVQDHYAAQISNLQSLIKTANNRTRSIRDQQHGLDAQEAAAKLQLKTALTRRAARLTNDAERQAQEARALEHEATSL